MSPEGAYDLMQDSVVHSLHSNKHATVNETSLTALLRKFRLLNEWFYATHSNHLVLLLSPGSQDGEDSLNLVPLVSHWGNPISNSKTNLGELATIKVLDSTWNYSTEDVFKVPNDDEDEDEDEDVAGPESAMGGAAMGGAAMDGAASGEEDEDLYVDPSLTVESRLLDQFTFNLKIDDITAQSGYFATPISRKL